ncbi:MAG: hypothetical protein M3N95_12315 [Actinomycetota bacterium]|nr:hypothetical protein [Actinomycetota bacterium]
MVGRRHAGNSFVAKLTAMVGWHTDGHHVKARLISAWQDDGLIELGRREAASKAYAVLGLAAPVCEV